MNLQLSDDEFFDLYIASADVVYSQGTRGLIFIKDNKFNYRYFTNMFKECFNDESAILSMENIAKIENKLPLGEDFIELKRNSDQQDIKVMETRKQHLFLHVDSYNQIGVLGKTPIINPATNNVLGVMGRVLPLAMPNLLDLIYRMHGIKFKSEEQIDGQIGSTPHKLNSRQHMVLFLYVNKYSYSEISSIMGALGQKLSAGRVNDHLEKLKYLFNAVNKNELIEKAILHKYHLHIPRAFLKRGSLPLDTQVLTTD